MTSLSSLSKISVGLAVAALGIAAAAAAMAAHVPSLQIAGLTGALAGLGLAAYGLFGISAALRETSEVCKRLAAGDFEARLQRFRDHGKLGDLRASFNDMIDRCDAFVREASAAMAAVRDNKYYRHILPEGLHGSLRIASQTMNEAMQVIERRVAAFNANTDRFEGAISEVIETVSSASGNMGTTAGSLGRGATATRERANAVSAASHQAAANMETVAAATAELSGAAHEISQNVSKSAQIARDAVMQVEQARQTVGSLNTATERIGSIVELIEEIASQTNLLALNATIEAARAGEAGRGFSVVAQEVKSLAAQTARATQDIVVSINEVQTTTKAAVDAISMIGGAIGQVDQITQRVAEGVQAQTHATGEVARNIEQAFAGIREISGNIQAVSADAGETEQHAETTLRASGTLAEQSTSLGEAVRDFLRSLRQGPRADRAA